MVKIGVNKKEMKNPQMHCPNPNCVDDNCHGECLISTAQSDDYCQKSHDSTQGVKVEAYYCEDS